MSAPQADRDPGAAAQLAGQIAAAVAGCPGVGGLFADGPLATYLPGRAIGGVAIREGAVVVAVTAIAGEPLHQIADRIHARLAGVVPGLAAEVRIEDITTPSPGSGEAG